MDSMQAGQPTAYDGMVVGQHDADHRDRHLHPHHRARAGRGLDLHGAAVLAHEALGGAQAEVVVARDRGRVEPDAVVDDLQHQARRPRDGR